MKIMLAVDDSKFSQAAVNTLIAQVQPKGAEVCVVHAIEPVPLYPDGQAWGLDDLTAMVSKERRREAEEITARASQTLRDVGFTVTTRVEQGDPKVVLLDLAEEWHADLVMLGSHGRKGLDRFLMGSVSEAVARHARCSVQIARIAGHGGARPN